MSYARPRSAAALGYRHAGCLQLIHRRPPEVCRLRTRPRTDVDPPRLELPSAGAYRLAAPGAVTCFMGDAENARHELAGHENAAPYYRGGKWRLSIAEQECMSRQKRAPLTINAR